MSVSDASSYFIGCSVLTHGLGAAEFNDLQGTVNGPAVTSNDGATRLEVSIQLLNGSIKNVSIPIKNLKTLPLSATAAPAAPECAQQQVTVDAISSFFCPLTLEVMKDPVIDAEGHTYERTSIVAFIDAMVAARKNVLSPMTRNPMLKTDLKPNYALKSAISEMTRALGGEGWQERSNFTEPNAATGLDPLSRALRAIRTGSAVLTPEIFAHLDAFVELDLVTTLQLKRPQIVVLGNESSGKSTFLERIMGFPIFPRDKKLCTRCVIRVHLRRSASGSTNHLAKLYVKKLAQPHGYNHGYNHGYGHGYDQYGRPSAAAKGVTAEEAEYVPLQLLSGRIQQLMLAMVTGKPLTTVVVDKEIVVEITVPYCPDIDLVDLPGLVEDPPETAVATQKLAQDIISREAGHSIFVAVVSSTLPVNQSKAIRLLRENNLLSKAVGILTKIDVFHSDDYSVPDEQALLEALDSSVTVSLPWVGTASTVSKGYNNASEMGHMLEMARFESEVLSARFSSLLEGKRVGIDIARATLLNSFESFLRTHWVEKITTKITEHLGTSIAEFKSLGMPCPPHATYLGHIATLAKFSGGGVDALKLTNDFRTFKTNLRASVLEELQKLGTVPPSDAPIWAHLIGYDAHVAKFAVVSHHYNNGVAVTKGMQCNVTELHGVMTQSEVELKAMCANIVDCIRNMSTSAAVIAAIKKAGATDALKLDRFQNLNLFLLRHIESSNWFTSFSASARALIEQRFQNPWVRKYGAAIKSHGRNVNSPVAPVAESISVELKLTVSVQTLGHDLISLWIDEFLKGISACMASWTFKLKDTAETVADARVRAFVKIEDSITALLALTKLGKL